MPVDDLRTSLAKANLEKQRIAEQDSKSPLENPKTWENAREKMRSGWLAPVPRFYIIISPDTLISTPQKLQEMAKMVSLPTVINTTYTGLHGGNPRPPQMKDDGQPQKVTVGEVTWEELVEVKDKTEYNVALFVWINEEVRGAVLVKGLKEVEESQADELVGGEK